MKDGVLLFIAATSFGSYVMLCILVGLTCAKQ